MDFFHLRDNAAAGFSQMPAPSARPAFAQGVKADAHVVSFDDFKLNHIMRRDQADRQENLQFAEWADRLAVPHMDRIGTCAPP
jgi:hypothetical protein